MLAVIKQFVDIIAHNFETVMQFEKYKFSRYLVNNSKSMQHLFLGFSINKRKESHVFEYLDSEATFYKF